MSYISIAHTDKDGQQDSSIDKNKEVDVLVMKLALPDLSKANPHVRLMPLAHRSATRTGCTYVEENAKISLKANWTNQELEARLGLDGLDIIIAIRSVVS